MATNRHQSDLGIIELFKDETRRRVIDYALREMNTDTWVRKGDITNAIDRTPEGVGKKIDTLVVCGVLDIESWDARLPRYRLADTPVTGLLAQWRAQDGYSLTELFIDGTHELIRFFFTQADDDESYSYGAIERESNASYYAASNHMAKLVDTGLVNEVEGARGSEYQFDPESNIARFLFALNEAVVECNKQRSIGEPL
jgi:hypothetical protein